MELNVSKISNHAQNPDNSVLEMKGQKGICCLAEGYNTPKDGGNSPESKVTRILVESYMKRPALSDEAMKNIFERANSGLMVSQSPQHPFYASASAVFFLKNKFVYASAGDNVIFHFVNGRIADVFCNDPGEEPEYLGVPGYTAPKVSDQVPFSKGNHTFLICTRAFADALDEEILEGSLSANTHVTQKGKQTISDVKCDRWLRELKDNIADYDSADANYSAIAFSMPEKKKSKLALIIIIAVVLLLIVAGLFLLRGKRPPQPPQGPGEGQEQIVGPNGEMPEPPQGGVGGLFGGRQQPPEPPTRPPLN